MKQFFCDYRLWEDYNAGLYHDKIINKEKQLILKSKKLLSNQTKFFASGIKMLKCWETSAKINLTNLSRNRQAWIGQATCCFNHKAPENITIFAWNQIENKIQLKANKTADKIIKKWESEYNAKN